MKNKNQILEQNQRKNEEIGSINDDSQTSTEERGEFKISVRKLQMPVRPRGVLAE